MKLNAFSKKVFTADIWDFVETIDTATGNVIRTYSYKETVKVNVVTDNTTRLIVYSDTPITKNYRLYNVLDRKGNEVMENYYWTVNTNEPMLNAFGFIEGYKVKTAAGVEIVNGNN